ncbi:hypothetical protein D3C76_1049580 [compost metagenome]
MSLFCKKFQPFGTNLTCLHIITPPLYRSGTTMPVNTKNAPEYTGTIRSRYHPGYHHSSISNITLLIVHLAIAFVTAANGVHPVNLSHTPKSAFRQLRFQTLAAFMMIHHKESVLWARNTIVLHFITDLYISFILSVQVYRCPKRLSMRFTRSFA